MPLKKLKTDTADSLTLEWVLYIKNYRLALDKNRCVGCQVCTLACPKEAIRLEKQPKIIGQKTRKAKLDVDLAKCNFCGICDVLCPYGAIKITLNNKHLASVVEKESFPQLIRNIQAETTKCGANCATLEDSCPLGLIKVTWLTSGGKIAEDLSVLTEEEKKDAHAKIDVEKDFCPCCRLCEAKGPSGVMHVRKFLSGKITINPEKCPEGCRDCLDVCPITGAIWLSEKDNKVYPNDAFCVYCGACKSVCPVEEALELARTGVNHTSVRSGAWNKALEKLASPVTVTKELKSKRSKKAVDSVAKRLGLKES